MLFHLQYNPLKHVRIWFTIYEKDMFCIQYFCTRIAWLGKVERSDMDAERMPNNYFKQHKNLFVFSFYLSSMKALQFTHSINVKKLDDMKLFCLK